MPGASHSSGYAFIWCVVSKVLFPITLTRCFKTKSTIQVRINPQSKISRHRCRHLRPVITRKVNYCVEPHHKRHCFKNCISAVPSPRARVTKRCQHRLPPPPACPTFPPTPTQCKRKKGQGVNTPSAFALQALCSLSLAVAAAAVSNQKSDPLRLPPSSLCPNSPAGLVPEPLPLPSLSNSHPYHRNHGGWEWRKICCLRGYPLSPLVRPPPLPCLLQWRPRASRMIRTTRERCRCFP